MKKYKDIPKKINIADKSNYSKGRKGGIEYIVIHFTANDGDTDEGNGKYFSRPNIGCSAHYFIDEDSITQSVKDHDTAWAVGAKHYKHTNCRNGNSISIEMCSDKNKNGFYISKETVENTVELVKYLMSFYKIPIENVLRHYDVTGKICPEPFVTHYDSWKRFKNMIEEDNMTIKNPIDNTPDEWAKESVKKAILKKLFVGDERGNYNWHKPMTKQEFVVILNRLGLL